MIEVFKTNIIHPEEADAIIRQLKITLLPKANINFDLQDCDRILRIEDDKICAEKVQALLTDCGYYCEVLE